MVAVSVAAGLRAWQCPGGARCSAGAGGVRWRARPKRSSSGHRSAGAEAVCGDGGVRGRSDRVERVMQRPARPGRRDTTAELDRHRTRKAERKMTETAATRS